MPQNDPTNTASHPAAGADPSPTVTGVGPDGAALPDCNTRENDCAAPPASGNRYVLGEEIARGGMGEVYRATDSVLNREVAVKVLQARYGPESGAAHRFTDEARITGQLQHPAIPPVHDLGTLPDGRPFLAMKLIKGQTLDDLLKARPDPSADRGRYVAVFEAVCQAVAYAHAHDVIHRDLKPANVMVGAFAEVQVMDWGLAKVLSNRGRDGTAADPNETVGGTEVVSLRDSDGSFTQAGSVLGTPAFMPPEQAIGAVSTIDRRSDVFGLGAILSVILTGRPPFVATSAETTRVKAAQGDVAECFAKLDECGAEPELVALCKRCLAPKQDDRPANAGEVATAVAEHRAAAAERARQAELDSVKSAEQRKRRRTQFVLAAVGVVLLASVGVGYALASLWRNAEEAKGKAVAAQEDAEAARERLARVEYGRTMQVAYQEYRENNVGAARKLLESTRPDLRGWEYHHLHRLCNADLLTLKGSSWKPQVSLDAKRILIWDYQEQQARLHDTETGKALLLIPDARSAALSRDGKLIAVIGATGVRLLDAGTGAALRTILGHSEDGSWLEFSPDGKRLAAEGVEATIRLWDVATGAEILKLKHQPNEPASFAFSPDSSRVVISCAERRVTVWDCTTGKELFACPAGKEEIYTLQYSPDGTRIASGGRERTVRIWDARTGTEERVLKVEHGSVTNTCFSPDGRTLAAAGWSMDTPILWDLATGRELPALRGHTGGLMSVAFNREGTRLITTGHDSTCRVWDWSSNKEILQLKGHANVLNFAVFLSGEDRIVTSAQDDTVKIWDARVACEMVTRFDKAVRDTLGISPDGTRVLCSEADNTGSICDAVTGEQLVHLKEVHSETITWGRFSPDGTLAFTVDVMVRVRIWDTRTGTKIQTLTIPFDAKNGNSQFGEFSPDGKKYVSAGTDNVVRLWNIESGQQLFEVPSGNSYGNSVVAFDPQGERFVVCGKSSLDIRDARTGERLTAFRWGSEKEDDWAQWVSYNREGTRLVTTHTSGVARVWDVRTGEMLHTLAGHSRMLAAADFSPDGTRIVTGGDDKTLRIWDATTGIEVLTLRGHTDQVGMVRFSPDGTRILSTGTDRTVRIWDSRPYRESRPEQQTPRVPEKK